MGRLLHFRFTDGGCDTHLLNTCSATPGPEVASWGPVPHQVQLPSQVEPPRLHTHLVGGPRRAVKGRTGRMGCRQEPWSPGTWALGHPPATCDHLILPPRPLHILLLLLLHLPPALSKDTNDSPLQTQGSQRFRVTCHPSAGCGPADHLFLPGSPLSPVATALIWACSHGDTRGYQACWVPCTSVWEVCPRRRGVPVAGGPCGFRPSLPLP